MAANIDDLMIKMENARSRLNSAIERITLRAEIYPTWSLKQLMDHITGWDVLLASSFRTHSSGDPPIMLEDRGIDGYNDESILARKELALDSSRKAYDEARLEVLETLHKMPPDMRNQKILSLWGNLCSIASVL